MKRVHRVHALRPLISNAALALLLAVLALYGIGREVWVAHVFANAPHALIPSLQFFIAAFINTRIIVQALCIAVIATLIWFMRDVARSLSASGGWA